MNRIQFLKRLLATLFGAATASSLRAEQSNLKVDTQPRYLLSATVAGQPYYDFNRVGRQLLREDQDIYTSIDGEFTEHDATLVLEPDNPYDYRAIAVYWKAHKMGYVPRRHNKVLYNLLKDGNQLQTKLRLQVNFEVESDHLYTYDFEFVYEMRIRVYLISENARSLLG